jgi:tungstate transport system substrate-binding protein
MDMALMLSRTKSSVILCFVLAIALLTLACSTASVPANNATAADATSPGQPTTQSPPQLANPDLILTTTTSTQDSGLLDVLIPLFERSTGYKVKAIAVGSGAALAMGERGEADVLLAHAPADEVKLVNSGAAINRLLVMHNDFVLVGPSGDPAGVKGLASASDGLKRIASSGALFISRGDNSGTHKKELDLWAAASATPSGGWYQQSGSGMGQTLSIASEKNGYTLTDRATYLALKKNLDLQVVLEGDASLLNIYHVMQVNPKKHAKVNSVGAKAFVDFMVSGQSQEAIKAFGVDKYGEPLFFPDAGKPEPSMSGGK